MAASTILLSLKDQQFNMDNVNHSASVCIDSGDEENLVLIEPDSNASKLPNLLSVERPRARISSKLIITCKYPIQLFQDLSIRIILSMWQDLRVYFPGQQ
jgi:hypothetical protein